MLGDDADDGHQQRHLLATDPAQHHRRRLTSSQSKVTYVFDQPFAIYRKGFLVDVRGGLVRDLDLSTGQGAWKTFQLAAYNGSALESFLWQQNARLDAVSTVRGIQFANETGLPVLTLTSANQSTELPKLCYSGNPSQPSGCPSDASLYYSASFISSLQSQLSQGYTVTLPRNLILYTACCSSSSSQSWKGAVVISELNTSTQFVAGYTISGAYAGGYTISEPVSFATVYNLTSPPTSTVDITQALSLPDGRNIGYVLGLTTESGDPVNMVTGNLYHHERDIAIKGRGLPLVFERSYNSRAAKDGPLGFGWTHSFNHTLGFNDDNANGVTDAADTDGLTSSVSWRDGTGSEKFILVPGTSAGVAIGSTFTTPKGLFFQMARASDGTYTVREKNGLTYTFESAAGTVGQQARLLSITDRNANVLTLNYDPTTGRLASVNDGVAPCPGSTCRSLTFSYDTNGRLTQVSDWTGRAHQYAYDPAGNLTSYKNPLAVAGQQNPVTYAYYDGAFAHAMQSYTLPRGNGMTFEYYANGNVFRHTTTAGEATTFTYDDFRRESVSTNPRGHTRHFFFDAYGNPTKIIEENGGQRTYTYDPTNPMNRVSRTDPLGYLTGYAYDANGNLTQEMLPSGATIQYSFFTPFNQPGKIKDARGNFTLLKYDSRGNLLEAIRLKAGAGANVDPATYVPAASEVAAWTINTYDGFGNVLTAKRVLDASTQAGPTEEFDYTDTVNGVAGLNLVSITRRSADGNVYATASLASDSLGRTTTGLRADWYPTQAAYDAVDRVTQATDEVGKLRDFAYDANGNLASNSLTVGGVTVDRTTFAYDLSDRKQNSTDAGGFITNFSYDATGNVIAIVNPDGFTLGFDYDANNYVMRAVDQEGNAVSRTLDLTGKPRTITDPNGHTTSFTYYGPEREGRPRPRPSPRRRRSTHGRQRSIVTRTATSRPSPTPWGGRR